MNTLGDKLRSLRHAKGWSQEYVAHELGISLPAYSKIERNITDINLSRLTQLSKLFGLPVASLLTQGEGEGVDYKKLLDERDKEIISLQKKIINLLEKNT